MSEPTDAVALTCTPESTYFRMLDERTMHEQTTLGDTIVAVSAGALRMAVTIVDEIPARTCGVAPAC